MEYLVKESESGNYLNEHGIKPSYQRIRIWNYLINTKEHPSVDMIYRSLAPDIPTLSRSTVYNSLSLFVERGIAQSILIDESETRYDADVNLHGHFHCRICGRVHDFALDSSSLKFRLPQGFAADSTQVCCQGICSGCADKKSSASPSVAR